MAVKPAKKLGAPNTIDLDALLAQPNSSRKRWLQERADRTITDRVAKGLREAETVIDLHVALDRVLDKNATPDIAPPGALVLQPNEERRRSGSHYTPRELTEPIVRHTLAPLLERLKGEDGRAPTPEQILDLKICDPAMGSGAFLVETCRQLADALIDAWGAHGAMPDIPPDEDEVIFARRLVAQKCLYGIDRNPMAVDLGQGLAVAEHAGARPSAHVRGPRLPPRRLARGADPPQIEALHWKGGQPILAGFGVREAVEAASALRRQIREADETVDERRLQNLWREAQDAVAEVRLFGDLVLAAFFEGAKPKERESRRFSLPGVRSLTGRRGVMRWRWRNAVTRKCRSPRSIGKSSSPRCSSATTQASTLSSAIHHSQGQVTTSSSFGTSTATRIGLKHNARSESHRQV